MSGDGVRRWLVTGASGQLGGHVVSTLSRRFPNDFIYALGHAPISGASVTEWVDLRGGNNVSDLLSRALPSDIIHLAGISVLAAETDPSYCYSLDVDCTRQLAAFTTAKGGWMLYASTDFVWGGESQFYTEHDLPRPKNVYGESKLAGEKCIRDHGCGLVVRYSLLVGLPVDSRQTPWTVIASKLNCNDPIYAVDDEWRSPITLAEAAYLTVELATRRSTGLVHISGSVATTPYEMLMSIRDEQKSMSAIHRISRVSYTPTVIRPRNVTQANSHLRSLLSEFSLRPLRLALNNQPAPVCLSVIIPVYNGAESLERSANGLASQEFDSFTDLRPDQIEVYIVLNDGRADSAAMAEVQAKRLSGAGFHVRILKASPSRPNAINKAEEECAVDRPRIYLDQDAVLSSGSVTKIFSALRPGSGIHFVTPQGRFERSPSAIVRSFCRYWSLLPYCHSSPVTFGVYAVSAEGRRRWRKLPDVLSDDKFVRLLFDPSERKLLIEESYHVLPPRSAKELVRARRRYIRGNRELASAKHGKSADPVPRYKGVLDPLVRQAAWFEFAVFSTVYAATWIIESIVKLRSIRL